MAAIPEGRDHERIWLEPAKPREGPDDRRWCQDDVWDGRATEYVRADLLPIWQPIETAPEGEIIGYNRHTKKYKIGERYCFKREWDAIIDRKSGRFLVCSDWMPLPEPPR
jgi:hypothetical protein